MAEWSDWKPVGGFDLEHLIYEKRYRTRGGGVARIRFDRPERMNALNGPMFQGIVDTLRDANRDSSVGVIVLSHTGPHFGVGGDLTGGVSSAMVLVDPTIKQCLKPVIAAVCGSIPPTSIGRSNAS